MVKVLTGNAKLVTEQSRDKWTFYQTRTTTLNHKAHPSVEAHSRTDDLPVNVLYNYSVLFCHRISTKHETPGYARMYVLILI